MFIILYNSKCICITLLHIEYEHEIDMLLCFVVVLSGQTSKTVGGNYYVPNAFYQRLNPLNHFILKNGGTFETENSDNYRRLQGLPKHRSQSASNIMSHSLR